MTQIIRYAELASTNDEALRLASEGTSNSWVMADVQTAGRGRRGRMWVSATVGNLYCSGIIGLRDMPLPAWQLSFIAALAVHDSLQPYVPDLKLKWPNDVLSAGQKLAGILLETSTAPSPCVIVGIGINLIAHPDIAERPATNIKAITGKTIETYALLETLITHFNVRSATWQQRGFAIIRRDWLACATGLGARIDVRLGAETLTGTFTDLAEDGALMLKLDSGAIKPIHAGEIFGIDHAACH